AGGIAHDFNNFLTCIMGNLALLERFVARDAEARAVLEHANTAVDSAASLTRQLLAFSRRQVISPRPVNLSALVERLGKMLLRLIGDRISLQVSCRPDLWIVNADPGQLEQILINLVMNARDAIAEGGQVSIETRNLDLTQPGADLPEPLRPGKYVALSVTDTGRGLSDVVRARLFEPFFTTKDAGEGTGLGLATAYHAVQQNGGVITVQSELGKGSTFRVLFPQVEAAPASEPAPAFGRRAALAVAGGTETILLVEDDPLVLELAHRTLQQLGYNVLPCGGSDEALRIFGEYQSRVELLVTDLVMPGMTGRELASRVASLSPGVAVLFIAGHGESKPPPSEEEPLAGRFAPPGPAGFIRKPYRPRELALEVRSLLDQRRKPR
ncbi:MAG TPA: ATP-binding protein, partial [Polyangiaceae bacterium]|nr:ATP-binding protein [Polyangiaceae bacterium]